MHEWDGETALVHEIEDSSKTFQLPFCMAGIIPVAIGQVGHEPFNYEGFP